VYYIYHDYIFTLDFPWLDLSGVLSSKVALTPSLSSTQTPNKVSLYPCYLRPLHAIEKMVARVSVLEGLAEREHDYALIISLDFVNPSAFIEAYTLIGSPDSSTLSHIY
jgi:hypothetical protein